MGLLTCHVCISSKILDDCAPARWTSVSEKLPVGIANFDGFFNFFIVSYIFVSDLSG